MSLLLKDWGVSQTMVHMESCTLRFVSSCETVECLIMGCNGCAAFWLNTNQMNTTWFWLSTQERVLIHQAPVFLLQPRRDEPNIVSTEDLSLAAAPGSSEVLTWLSCCQIPLNPAYCLPNSKVAIFYQCFCLNCMPPLGGGRLRWLSSFKLTHSGYVEECLSRLTHRKWMWVGPGKTIHCVRTKTIAIERNPVPAFVFMFRAVSFLWA